MQLGKGCRYVLTINDQKRVFNSEQELDAFLKDHVDGFVIDKLNNTFSISPQKSTLTKINQISQNLESISKKRIRYADDPESVEEYYEIPNSIGVNKFITTKGNYNDINKALVTPFNLDVYKKNKINALMDVGFSKSEAENMLKNLVDSWEDLTDIGTEIHAILEDTIKGTNVAKTPILEKSGLVDSVKKSANELIEKIKLKHGSDAELISELGIISKRLNSNLEELLKVDGKTSINGKIDLLVIDRDGVSHIYDFKVSRKEVGDWNNWINPLPDSPEAKLFWHTTKKLGITYQLGMYTAILRQHGIQVGSTNICPIKLDVSYEDEHETKIKSFNEVTFNNTIENIPETRAGSKYNRIMNLLPPEITLSNEDTLKIFDTLNLIAPNTDLQMKIERKHADIEFYKSHPESIGLRKVSKDSSNYGIYKWVFRSGGVGSNNWVYAKNDEDLQVKLEEYVEQLTAKRANEMRDLSEKIENAIESGKYEDIGIDYKDDQKSFLANQFKKYAVHKWSFEKNENLNSAGIFIFKKSGRTEIVVISNKPLAQTLNLGMGTSLLGKTLSNENVSRKEILDASYGNLEMLKALIYVSQNQELFLEDKISEIRTINPWSLDNKEISAINSQLLNNYNMICMQNQDIAELKKLRSDIFWDDVTALLSTAYDKQTSVGEGWIDFELQPDARDMTYTADWIKRAINKLKVKYPELYNIENYTDNDIWNTYVYLYRAYNAASNIYTIAEQSPGEFFGRGGIKELNGYMISAGQFSPSANLQIFSEVHDQYVAEVRQKVQQRGQKMIKYFTDFYEESRRIAALGGERNLFKSWFITDSEGNIDDSFSLKNPMSSEFNGTPKARQAMLEFLRIMWKLKHPTNSEEELIFDEEQALSGHLPEYFEVPLTQGRFTTQVKNLGIWNAIKNKFNEAKQLTTDMFAEDEFQNNENLSIRDIFKAEHKSVYNKFALESDQRLEKIKNHKVGFFETHIELIFNEALVAYTKQEVSKKYVPIFQGMRLSLEYQKHHSKENNDKVVEAFDKLLASKFYGESIVSKDLQPLQRWMNVIKRGFSTMTLGLNFTSFFREMLVGTYTGFSRSGVELIDGINAKTYLQGAKHIIKDARKNFSGISLLQQLNQQYGMANMSLTSIANQRRMNWFGIKNWGKDTMFLTASSPDFQHRMAILVAKMIGDGCWDAHSLDKDGNLTYDWTKDKRFDVYRSNDTNHKDYLYQKTLYLKYLEEFNRIGFKKLDGTSYQEGDALPQAYPPKEGQRLKNFADLLYGHYDDESRALINDTFLGSFFMQYKTFATAKVEQWFNKPGIYNTEHLKQQYDPITKERLYVKYVYPNADNTGVPQKEIVKESQLTEEDKKSKLVESYIKWEGDPMEGMFHSSWSVIKTLNDPKEFKKMWSNPLKKAQFILSLNDTLLMALMSLILTALFAGIVDEDNWWSSKDVMSATRESGMIPDFGYKIFWGMTQDSNIFNVVSSMFSDVNPPLFTSTKKLASTIGSTLAGNTGLAEAIVSQFGALKPLQTIIREWEQN